MVRLIFASIARASFSSVDIVGLARPRSSDRSFLGNARFARELGLGEARDVRSRHEEMSWAEADAPAALSVVALLPLVLPMSVWKLARKSTEWK